MKGKAPWWKERVFYQIYPRSFQDSNGDGIGDIRGIISRLDYLKWLGIGAVWLCPVYDSPNADMGYDIRDYEKIMEEFGNMEDMDELIEQMHKRDMKLVMDLVVNHSSDEHDWFIRSRESVGSQYRDYYIWRDGKNGREPNNWASFFTPSAWTYDEGTGQWYLHLFSEKQPDLNWECANMRRQIYEMINRWLDRGVDGFRMDVVSAFAKAPGLPDGEGEGYVFTPEYFAFQPKLHDYLREMRSVCFEGRDCMCVGEATFATPEDAAALLSDGRELDMIFEFDAMDIDSDGIKWNVVPFDLKKLKRTVNTWQKAIDWNTLFWGNHDQPRVVSRFGDTSSHEMHELSAKCLAAAMYLQRGTAFIYQGEEIGMTNYPFRSETQLRDVESLNLLEQAEKEGRRAWAWNGILRKGRDNSRTPMQWDDSENAGFSSSQPWIAVNPNCKQVNVRHEMDKAGSVLRFYRELIALRNGSDTLKHGTFSLMAEDDDQIFAYERAFAGETIWVICNISKTPAALPRQLCRSGKVLMCSGGDGISEVMQPYETRVISFVR